MAFDVVDAGHLIARIYTRTHEMGNPSTHGGSACNKCKHFRAGCVHLYIMRNHYSHAPRTLRHCFRWNFAHTPLGRWQHPLPHIAAPEMVVAQSGDRLAQVILPAVSAATAAKPAKVPYFYAIGIADPGTGSKDGYFFTASELAEVVRSKCMHGIQVWLEHGDASREVIGDVAYSWVDKQAGLMTVLRFDSSTLRSKVILEWIKNGLFSGISLGYNADVKYIDGLIIVHKKTIIELSIVRDPFHKSCKIGFIGNSLPLHSDNKNDSGGIGHNSDGGSTVCGSRPTEDAGCIRPFKKMCAAPCGMQTDDYDPWKLMFSAV